MTDLISRPTWTCLTCGTVHYSPDAYIACRDSHPPPTLVERLRYGSIDDDLLDAAKEAANEIERLRAENAVLKREAYTWWQLAASAPQDERKRCAALCKAQADRWADDRARYAAIACAKAIEAQVPT